MRLRFADTLAQRGLRREALGEFESIAGHVSQGSLAARLGTQAFRRLADARAQVAAILAARYRPGVEAIAGINARHPIYRLLTLLEQTAAASSARLGRRGGRRRS